ncbi:hypothetical protein OGAPHI_003169 [Ogataea philodendri]|uniref:Zn(2)-C6 fungal-type domain-containing protein n=2 Tax=Saccharomycotina TaxID=147537 RepID=A0A9P8T6W5_9ASCO|nr:uncharacterized protein OGAPHI_003169 [Ogataea philodendri]KAH3667520.1 hypothetical protein OGAPHI_003169 [Ogataea philodendri]
MRVSIACEACRHKKIKCVHEGKPPCQACKIRGLGVDCQLFSTQEFRKFKRGNSVLARLESGNLEISGDIVKSCIQCVARHYPELVFLSFPNNIDLVSVIDQVVALGLCALSAPFIKESLDSSPTEILNCFETKLMEKIDDKHSIDYLSLLQASIVWLLLNWQTGKSTKGYLFGGFADRVYIMLTKQKTEHSNLFEQEFYVRTLWAYQLTCLSLREGSSAESKSRLFKFRLPISNQDILFRQAGTEQTLDKVVIGKTTNLFSLFVYGTHIWTDCCTWVFKGGRNSDKTPPWNPNSEWSRLKNRIEQFESQLGPKMKYSPENLEAHYALGQGSIFFYMHLGLYTSKILICRNYFPFVPLDHNGPKGPFPMLPELKNAPEGWWSSNAHTVFESSRVVSMLFQGLDIHNLCPCNSFSGFCALTAASMLIYIYNFPSYDPLFHQAEVYYNNCEAFLQYYEQHWELGKYYHDFLKQTTKMLQAASTNKITVSSISAFENMKDELLDVANVAAPLPKADRLQIENLIDSPRSPRTPKTPSEECEWPGLNMAWAFDWSNLGTFTFNEYMN